MQKQITDETKSSDDTKTKTQVVQELQAELESLQMVMEQKMTQQAQAKKAAEPAQNAQKPVKAGIDDGVGVNLDTSA